MRPITREDVKRWVDQKCSVTNSYRGKTFYASVTIGYDINGSGASKEAAIDDLVGLIYSSEYILGKLSKIQSFIEIIGNIHENPQP